MAVTFTNNWKNILDKLESVIESEFKGALHVYKGNNIPKGVSQAIQLIPTGSDLLDFNATSETREFSITVRFVSSQGGNLSETSLDHILRYISRIEALIHDNISMTLADNTSVHNCRFESTELDSTQDTGVYTTEWVWKCSHQGNFA